MVRIKAYSLFLAGTFLLHGCSNQQEKPASTASMLVINVLDKAYYDDVHIKGSIHVPMMDVPEYVEKIDKNTPIVFYCSNYACGASGASAQQLQKMGFKNVWAYEGGMAEWYQQHLPVEGQFVGDNGLLTKETQRSKYLTESNPQSEMKTADVPVIGSQELYKMMHEHSLLKQDLAA